MIYPPIELQLQMIREDLMEIKRYIIDSYPRMPSPCCPDCGDESSLQNYKCVNKCQESNNG